MYLQMVIGEHGLPGAHAVPHVAEGPSHEPDLVTIQLHLAEVPVVKERHPRVRIVLSKLVQSVSVLNLDEVCHYWSKQSLLFGSHN